MAAENIELIAAYFTLAGDAYPFGPTQISPLPLSRDRVEAAARAGWKGTGTHPRRRRCHRRQDRSCRDEAHPRCQRDKICGAGIPCGLASRRRAAQEIRRAEGQASCDRRNIRRAQYQGRAWSRTKMSTIRGPKNLSRIFLACRRPSPASAATLPNTAPRSCSRSCRSAM